MIQKIMVSKWKKDILWIINKPIKVKDEIRFIKDGKLHNIDFPAYIWYYPDGTIQCEEYYFEGKLHRPFSSSLLGKGGPARIWYYPNGNTQIALYQMHHFKNKHSSTLNKSEEKPVRIDYYPDNNNQVMYQVYYFEDKIHRPPEDGPAIIRYNLDGTIHKQVYYVNGIKQ